MKDYLAFQTIRSHHNNFAWTLGIQISCNPTVNPRLKLNFCILSQIILLVHITIVFGFMIYEHFVERAYFLGDCRSAIIMAGVTCITTFGLIFYLEQKNLTKLFDWCEKIVPNEDFKQELSLSTIRFLHNFSYSVPILSSLGSIGMNFFVAERQMPIAIYSLPEVTRNFEYYMMIFIFHNCVNLVFWKYTCFVLSTFVILVKHLSGQYKMLTKVMGRLGVESKNHAACSQKLDLIGLKHSELILMLKETSRIYRVILILNELFCIICIVVSITILAYEFEEAVFGFAVILITALSLQYPLLGEEVSSTAEEFCRTVYECDWVHFSNRNRKKLALILLMAQQPVGVSSGGFHNANYLEVSQVSKPDVKIYFKYYKTLIFLDISKCLQFVDIR